MAAFRDFILETKTGLEYHDQLNDKLWKDDKLKPEILQAMLKFADAWAKFVHISDTDIKDIIFTGGAANFNFSPASDLDVHLVMDTKKIDASSDLVTDYLQAKKTVWQLQHNIKIAGYPVEPYVQDITEKFHPGQGVYSLKNDSWIQKPEHGTYNFDDKTLKRKVAEYKRLIKAILKQDLGVDKAKEIKDKLNEMRNSGIAANGEFATENLIFKAVRNSGLLDKLKKYIKDDQDKELSA